MAYEEWEVCPCIFYPCSHTLTPISVVPVSSLTHRALACESLTCGILWKELSVKKDWIYHIIFSQFHCYFLLRQEKSKERQEQVENAQDADAKDLYGDLGEEKPSTKSTNPFKAFEEDDGEFGYVSNMLAPKVEAIVSTIIIDQNAHNSPWKLFILVLLNLLVTWLDY